MPTVNSVLRLDPKGPRSRWIVAIVGVAAFMLVALVGVLQCYVSFKYPLKWDRYRHRFSEHVIDRAKAYALLLRSSHRWENGGLSVEAIQQIVSKASAMYAVDRCLVAAVVTFESGFNPNTVTTTGAMGLMALQPATAVRLGVRDPFDPVQNVDGGTRMLRDLLTSFDGDRRLALAGYNAGAGTVARYAGVPPFRETHDYVRHVSAIYELCRSQTAAFFPSID